MMLIILLISTPLIIGVLSGIGERNDAMSGYCGPFSMDKGDGSYWEEYKQKYPTLLDSIKHQFV